MFGKKKDLVVGGNVVEGLPVVNTAIAVTMEKDQLVFNAYLDKHIYNLPLNRVSRMQICGSTEYETIRPSLIKSVAGGALFGVPGAIVGAMPKEKKTTYWILTIVYDKGLIAIRSVR